MNKLKKVAVVVVVLGGILFLSSHFIVKAVFYNVVANVNKEEGYPYFFSYQKTGFNFFTGNAKIHQLKLEIKPGYFNYGGHILIDEVSIEHLQLLQILKNNFKFSQIVIDGPEVEITFNENKKLKSVKTNNKDIGTLFAWNKLVLKNGSLQIIHPKHHHKNIKIKGIDITIGAKESLNLKTFFGEGHFVTESVSFDVFNEDRVRAESIEVDLKRNKIKMNHLVYSNWLEKENYYKTTHFGNTYKHIEVDSLVVLDFNKDPESGLTIQQVKVCGTKAYVERLKYLNSHKKDTTTFRFNVPDELQIGQLSVIDASFEYRYKKFEGQDFKSIGFHSFETQLGKNSLDYLLHSRDTLRPDSVESFIRFSDFKYNFSPEFELHLASVYSSIKGAQVKVEQLRLKNNYDPIKYIQRQSFHEDWKDIKVDSVVTQANVLEVLKYNYWQSDFTNIYGLYFDLKEPGDIKKMPNKKAELLHDWLRAIPFDHDLKALCLVGGKLDFGLYFNDAQEVGKINFTEINGCLDRVSNMDKNHVSKLAFTGRIFGKHACKLNIELPVYHKNYNYALSGEIGKMPFSKLNSMFNAMGLNAKSGNIEKLMFSYTSTGFNSQATGISIFQYYNLDLEILPQITEEKIRLDGTLKPSKVKKNKVLSWAAEKVVKSDNMPNSPYYVTGIIDRRRLLYQSFFGQMIKCMLQGSEFCVTHKRNKGEKRKKN